MTEIYDLVLNFTKAENEVLDFYEWNKNDKLTYISKIPIIKINTIQMIEVLNNIIKLDKSTLIKIKNKTKTEDSINPYCLLVTDSNKVIALMFSSNGVLEKRSSLLLDEEEAVIEESRESNLEILNYTILKHNNNYLFLTREDKVKRLFLINKIKYLYENKEYDELDYLYQEITNKHKSYKLEYNFLLNEITNNYNSDLNKLYDIIKLTANNN